ncbi:MAG: hypothetical protein Pars2KO_20320 [Parasphingorhabdus sp.]
MAMIINIARKIRHLLALLPVSIIAFGAPVSANQNTEQSAKQEDEIVVIGSKEQMAEFKNLIVNHFNVSGGGRYNGQYARFARAVCPSVTGLSERQADAIRDRMRQVAKMSGIPVAAENCRPNMFVAVVEDGATEIKQLRRKKARLFNSLTHRERDKIEESGGPVYSWKATETVASDSRHNARAGSINLPAGENGAGLGAALGGASGQGQRTQVKSRVMRSTMEGIAYSYLLIDIDALKGISAAQLADYSAIMSLIDIDFSGDKTVPTGSMLSLFSSFEDDALRPTSLSGGDLLLLRGLYKVPANVKAPLQRSAMIHTMSEGLKNPKQVKR